MATPVGGWHCLAATAAAAALSLLHACRTRGQLPGSGGGAGCTVVDSPPAGAAAPAEAAAVLAFWFGNDVQTQYSTLWFAPANSALQSRADENITSRFGGLLARAESGALDSWRETPDGLLALLVLLDQFSRHVYRHHPSRGRSGVEPNDRLALECAEELLRRGWQDDLGIAQLVFALMPLVTTSKLSLSLPPPSSLLLLLPS